MSYDIQLDMSALSELAHDLASVIDEFEKANDNARGTADATGSRELADRVRDFAQGWNIRRGKMIEDITTLQETIAAIVATFTEADEDMARALEEAVENPTPAADVPGGGNR